MSAMTNNLEAAVSNTVLRNAAYAYAGQALTLALFVNGAAPADDGTGGTEASWPAYARVAVSFTEFDTPAADGIAENQNALTFPTVDGGSSVAVGSWALYAGATMVLTAPLAAAKTLDVGDVPSFPAGSLKVIWA